MVSPLARLSLNVNMQKVGDFGKLLRTINAWKPGAIVCMHSLNAADPNNVVVQVRDRMAQWGGIVIYRHFEVGEDNLWSKYPNPEDYLIKIIRPYGTNSVWFYVGNEPAPGSETEIRKMSKWYADLIRINFEKGYNYRLVVPGGFPSGSFEKWQVDAGWFDDMLREIGKNAHRKVNGWSQIAFGSHEYGLLLPMLHTDGANYRDLLNRDLVQPERWKTVNDIFDNDNSDNWLILRTEWYIDRMVAITGIARDAVDVHLTEVWHDRMPHIAGDAQVQPQLDAIAGREIRGIRTVQKYYEWAFGHRGWTSDRALCEVFLWGERTYPRYYRSFAIFSWTWDDDWPLKWRQDYNVGEMDYFLLLWPSFIPKIGGVPMTPTPPPEIPSDPGDPVQTLLIPASVRIRRRAGTAFPIVDTLPAGANLLLYPDTVTSDKFNNFHWVFLKYKDQPGWMAILDGTTRWESQFRRVPAIHRSIFVDPLPTLVTQLASNPGADEYANDCGPAMFTELALWWAGVVGVDALQGLVPDEVSRAINKSFEGFTDGSDLIRAAAHFKVPLLFVSTENSGMTPARVRSEIEANRPVGVLIDYRVLGPSRADPSFNGSHWLTVVGIGFDIDNNPVVYYLDDPLGKAKFAVAADAFESGIRTTPGNIVTYQGFAFDPDHFQPQPTERSITIEFTIKGEIDEETLNRINVILLTTLQYILQAYRQIGLISHETEVKHVQSN